MKESEVDKILKWLNSIEIDIAEDPLMVGGFKYISKKLSEIHGYLEPLNNYQVQVAIEIRNLDKKLNTARRQYEFELAEKLANDDDVKAQKSYKDREALARSMLKDLVSTIEDLEEEKHSLEQFERVLKLKISNLQRANRDIRLQEKALSTDLRLSLQAPSPPDDSESDYKDSYNKLKQPLTDEDFPDDLFGEEGDSDSSEEKSSGGSAEELPSAVVEKPEPEPEPELTEEEEDHLDGEIQSAIKDDDLSSVLADEVPEDDEQWKQKEEEREAAGKAAEEDEEIDLEELFADL